MEPGLTFNLEVRETTSYRIEADRFIKLYADEWKEFTKEYDEDEEPDSWEIRDFILGVIDLNGELIDGVDGPGWQDTEYDLEERL